MPIKTDSMPKDMSRQYIKEEIQTGYPILRKEYSKKYKKKREIFLTSSVLPT